VRVDPVRHIANEGSVTVMTWRGAREKEILVGLHASAWRFRRRHYVVVANSGSDTLHVIDTRTDEVIEKIWARQTPADLFGAQRMRWPLTQPASGSTCATAPRTLWR